MHLHHHIAKKFQDSKNAPLWKWAVVIFIIVAMPLLFAFVNMTQTQQAIVIDEDMDQS